MSKIIPSNILTEKELETAELFSFKILPIAFIENSINTEKIYFGCADKYSYEYERDKRRGQGDPNEGLFARVSKKDIAFIRRQEQIHGQDLIKIDNDNFVDLKLRTVVNMPTYCFYSLNSSNPVVEISKQPGDSDRTEIYTYKFVVPRQLLQDFSKDGFGILSFLNWRLMYECIKNALAKKEIVKVEIHRIRYVDRENRKWVCPENHPFELLYKDLYFRYQNEARIIVRDERASLIDKVERKDKILSIDIGDAIGLIQKHPIKTDGDIKIQIRGSLRRI